MRKELPLHRIERLIASAHALELGSDAVQRLRWFAFAAAHGGNISLTCRHFGIARSTFLLWAKRFDPRDERSLEERSRRPRRVRQPQIPADAIVIIRSLREAQPYINATAIQSILLKRGFELSPSTIVRTIARHHLFFGDSPSHREKRRSLTGYSQALPPVTDNNCDFALSLFPSCT